MDAGQARRCRSRSKAETRRLVAETRPRRCHCRSRAVLCRRLGLELTGPCSCAPTSVIRSLWFATACCRTHGCLHSCEGTGAALCPLAVCTQRRIHTATRGPTRAAVSALFRVIARARVILSNRKHAESSMSLRPVASCCVAPCRGPKLTRWAREARNAQCQCGSLRAASAISRTDRHTTRARF